MNIEIKAIFISPGHDFKARTELGRLEHGIQSLDAVECVAGSGLVGDRYFDFKNDYKGQVTFFDWAVYEAIQKEFDCPEIEPWVFRRNILTAGVDLNSLIGERFTFQGLTFEGSEEAAPCHWMDKVVKPGVHDALKGRGGIRARILSDGTLTCTGLR
jgi:MOSC domain-containing protein YiiM